MQNANLCKFNCIGYYFNIWNKYHRLYKKFFEKNVLSDYWTPPKRKFIEANFTIFNFF